MISAMRCSGELSTSSYVARRLAASAIERENSALFAARPETSKRLVHRNQERPPALRDGSLRKFVADGERVTPIGDVVRADGVAEAVAVLLAGKDQVPEDRG